MHSEDQNMEDVMDGTTSHQPQGIHQVSNITYTSLNTQSVLTEMDYLYQRMRAVIAGLHPPREQFKEISVKVHIRRPERDTWAYMGRGIVTQELTGQSSRVVLRAQSSHKILAVFGEDVPLQAERRGNFVVIGCVDGNQVVSWSLNALNNSDTVRLLASIELACYASKQAMVDPIIHGAFRRRVARVIKDDRRRRHRRRRDQESMIDAFARTGLGGMDAEEDSESGSMQNVGAPPPAEPVAIPAPAVAMAMPTPEPAPASDLALGGNLFAGYSRE